MSLRQRKGLSEYNFCTGPDCVDGAFRSSRRTRLGNDPEIMLDMPAIGSLTHIVYHLLRGNAGWEQQQRFLVMKFTPDNMKIA